MGRKKKEVEIIVEEVRKPIHRILAVDQATQISGYCILEDNEILDYGLKKFNNGNIVQRMIDMRNWIIDMVEEFEIDVVLLEDIQLQANKNTFMKLSGFLYVLQTTLLEHDTPYEIVPCGVWRKHCEIKGKKRQELKSNSKKFVFEHFGLQVSDDTSDAICLAIYGHANKDTLF